MTRKHETKQTRLPETRSPETRSWPVTCRWLAMGTVVVYTAIGSRTVSLAAAQQLPSPANGSQGPTQTLPFHIPPGNLETVLTLFENATRLHVVIPDARMAGVASPGVSGVFRPERALEQLLKGTGLGYRYTGALTVTLEVSRVSASVNVTASADSVNSAVTESLPKYTEPLRDIPQTINVVPQSVIEEQNATTLRDTLRNVAGISLAAGEGGSQGDSLTIRGFTARTDLFIDGMRDYGNYYRDPFNLQEVEVLQGPSSVTFGRGSTGGVVNQETKTPQLNRFIAADFDLGTDLTRRLTVDIDTPVPELGPHAAFRLNVMGDEGNVAGRNVAENRRFGVAPTLALGIGTPTRITFSYFHQNADDIPDYGVPWLYNGPAPVPHDNYYGFAKGNFLRTYDDLGTIRAEHDFNSHLTLRNQVRYASYVRDVQITEPQLYQPGTTTPYPVGTPLSAMVVTRNELAANSTETYFTDQLDLTVRFETGFLKHTLITGAEVGRETSDPVRPKFTNVPTTSLLDPDPGQAFSGTETISSIVHTRANTVAAYALDTVQLAKKWQLIGGIRWDRFNAHYTQQVAPASAYNELNEVPTWRAGLVYKPVQAGSLYVSAGTSFNPSAEMLALSAATANLPPERNRTVEGGAKWDLLRERLSLSAAIFSTNKTNAREPDPANALLDVLAGNQRVNGTQVGIRGHITSRWQVLASYAYLDGKLVSSSYYPAAVGAQLANVPRDTFNFWNTFRLPGSWEIGGGSNYVSSRTASSTTPDDPTTGLVKKVPGYWVFNAMAEHRLNEHVRLQANVYNIANRYYYDQLHPGHVVPGPGRSALIGLKFNF